MVGGYVQSINYDYSQVEKRVWGKIANEISNVKCQMQYVNILILGLGAGTEVHLLSQKFPHAQITAVEIDPVIIQVAKDYFDVGKIPNLKIITDDAFEFLQSSKQCYDVAVCDFYAGGKYPKQADSDEFLSNLAKRAKIVVFNRIFDSVKSNEAKEFGARVKHYFGAVKVVPVKHNALNILYLCGTLG